MLRSRAKKLACLLPMSSSRRLMMEEEEEGGEAGLDACSTKTPNNSVTGSCTTTENEPRHQHQQQRQQEQHEIHVVQPFPQPSTPLRLKLKPKLHPFMNSNIRHRTTRRCTDSPKKVPAVGGVHVEVPPEQEFGSQPGMMSSDTSSTTTWAEFTHSSSFGGEAGEMDLMLPNNNGMKHNSHTNNLINPIPRSFQLGGSVGDIGSSGPPLYSSLSAPNSPRRTGLYNSPNTGSQTPVGGGYGYSHSTPSSPYYLPNNNNYNHYNGYISNNSSPSTLGTASSPYYSPTPPDPSAFMMTTTVATPNSTPTRQRSFRGPLTTPLPRRSPNSYLQRSHSSSSLSLPSLTLPAPDEPEPCPQVLDTLILLKSIKQQIKAMKRREFQLSTQLNIQRRERQQMQEQIAQLETRRLRVEALFVRPLPLVLLLPVVSSSSSLPQLQQQPPPPRFNPYPYSASSVSSSSSSGSSVGARRRYSYHHHQRHRHQNKAAIEYDLCLVSEGQDAWNALKPLVRIQLVPGGSRASALSSNAALLLHFGPTLSQPMAAAVCVLRHHVANSSDNMEIMDDDSLSSVSSSNYNSSCGNLVHCDLQPIAKHQDEVFWERVTSGQILPADANQLDDRSCRFLFDALTSSGNSGSRGSPVGIKSWRDQLTHVMDKKTRRIQWVLHQEANALYYDAIPSPLPSFASTTTTAMVVAPSFEDDDDDDE